MEFNRKTRKAVLISCRVRPNALTSSLFTHNQLLLFPFPSVFLHLFFHKPLWSLPFPTLISSPKHPIMSCAMAKWSFPTSHNGSHILISSNPHQSVRWSREPLLLTHHGGCHPWTKRLMAVLGQHWEELRQCSISLTVLWGFLHTPTFLCAPLCVCRQAFYHIT